MFEALPTGKGFVRCATPLTRYLRRQMNTRVLLALTFACALGACASDPDDSQAVVSEAVTSAPATSVPTTDASTSDPSTTDASTTDASTTQPAPTTTEAAIVIPPGILAAMPFQNRLDVAQGIFQVKLYNGTDQRFDIVGVQLLWDGLTTPVSERQNPLIAGDRLDYPVTLAAATCVGNGAVGDMPDPQQGVVRVLLADGGEVLAPVFDVKHFARRLYLEDCERQFIAKQVAIEWVDMHEATLDDRPVTEGFLRLTRLEGNGRVTVFLVSNNILFTFAAAEPGDGPVAVLPVGEQTVSVPIRFTEGRCDAHAMSETSQPFLFQATLDLGDDDERSYAMPIPLDDQIPMRHRLEAACAVLGEDGAFNEG